MYEQRLKYWILRQCQSTSWIKHYQHFTLQMHQNSFPRWWGLACLSIKQKSAASSWNKNLSTFKRQNIFHTIQSDMTKKPEIYEITLTFRPLVFCTCNEMNHFHMLCFSLKLSSGKSIRHCASLLSLSILPKVPHPVHQRPRGRWENTARLREVDTGAGASASARMNSQLMWFQEKPPVNVWPQRAGPPRVWL